MRHTLTRYVVALGLSAVAWGLPQDPTTAHGQVQIQNLGPNFLQILQSSPQAILNWNQFNIGLGETVRFLQPSTQAAILNRVTGTDPSLIQGMLQANGRVFLLNPNGILFGPNSMVDVGSFTASTLKMSDDDFLSGNFRLTQDRSMPLAALTNQGQIRVAEGGFVVLVSPLLDNQGMIVAQSGQVNLGATTQATFSVDGRGLVQFAMPDGFNPQFTGGGQGGTVLLQPGQMSQMLSQVVNNPTLVEAGSFQPGSQGQTLAHGAEGVLLNSGTIQADGGTIRLDSSQATIHGADGVLSAAAGDVRLLSNGATVSLGRVQSENGFAEVSGHHLWLYGSVDVGTAGTLLLDPDNIQIVDGTSGSGSYDAMLGSLPGTGDGSVSTGAIVAATNLVLNANNDISYSGNGFFGPSTNLTLMAGNDITINTAGTIELGSIVLDAGRHVTLQNGGNLQIWADNGPFTVNAGGNVNVVAGNNMDLRAIGSTLSFHADNDLNITGGNGYTISETAALTNLSAGQDVNILVQNWNQPGTASVVNIDATRDFNLNSYPPGSTNMVVGGLNVTAARDISTNQVGSLTITAGNDLKLAAGRNLTMNEGALALTAQNGVANLSGQQVNLSASGDVVVQGKTALSILASGGNVTTVAGGLNTLLSPSGSLTVRAEGGSITDTAGTNLRLGGATTTSVNASDNLSIRAGDGYTVTLDGTSHDLRAGGNLSLRANNVDFNGGGGPLNLTAANDVNLTSFSGLAIGVQSLAVNATRDITIAPPLSLSVTTTGNQTYTAGRNLLINNGGAQTLTSNNGQVVLRGGNVTTLSGSSQHYSGLNGVNIASTSASGDVNMTLSGGEIVLDSSNGPVNITSQRDIFLKSPADIGLLPSATQRTTINATRDVVIDSGDGFTQYYRGLSAQVQAGRDLTLRSNQILNNSPNTVLNLEAGQDMFLGNRPLSVLRIEGASINATAQRDLQAGSVSSLSIQGLTGDTKLRAGRNLTLDSGGTLDVGAATQLTIQGQAVNSRSQSSTNLAGTNGVTLSATAGNVDLNAIGDLNVRSTSGGLRVTASQDIGVNATSDIRFQGATPGVVSAGRDLAVASGQGRTLDLSGGAYLSGGRNVSLTNDRIASGDVSIESGTGNVVIRSTPFAGTSNQVDVSSLNVTSGNDLLVLGDNSVDLTGQAGDVRLNAGRNLTVQANSGHTNVSASGQIRVLAAQNVTTLAGQGSLLSAGTGLNITATAGNVDMQTPTSLELRTTSGPLRVVAGQDINLQPNGNLNLRAPAASVNVSAGRDLTLTAPLGTSITLDSPTTLLSGGRNVTFTGDQLSGDRLNLRTTTGNVTFQGLPGRKTSAYANTALNISAGNDLLANADGNVEFVNFGTEDLKLTAGRNITLQAGGRSDIVTNGAVLVSAGSNVTTRAGTGSLILGSNGVAFTSPGGDVDLQVSAGPLEIKSTVGSVAINNLGDINLQAGTTVNVSAATETTMNPGGSIHFTTGPGSALTLDGQQSLAAGRDINFNTNRLTQTVPGAVSMFASNDINLPPARSGTFTVDVGSFHAAAGHDLRGTVNGGDLNINASTGGIYLRGDNQLDLNTTGGGTHLNAANGNVSLESSQGIALGGTVLTIDAGGLNITTDRDSVFAPGSVATAQSQGISAVSTSDLDLRNLRLTSNGGGAVVLHADGNLRVGPVATTAVANATLSGGNIVIHSLDDISGGNYTVTTAGNLTDEVPASNTPPVLTGLDITAAHIFNPNNVGDLYAFSIPRTTSPANLHVLVTGGNQTVGSLTSSASLRNRNSADVQPNPIQGQTGDIYVDGLLYYEGEAVAPPPPPPPPSPPPVPPVSPDAAAVALQQANPLTAEQRSQLLAQSNLALGNLGSFSRVLSDSERERLTVRQDSLNQTWALDPFSPTLALVLPGGRPLVYPSELAQLQALLRMSTPEDDPEEKIRGAYNTIVDQELREIWEVRYWRHLLENFVIWEDRE